MTKKIISQYTKFYRRHFLNLSIVAIAIKTSKICRQYDFIEENVTNAKSVIGQPGNAIDSSNM
jgi:hypothetical protein